MNDRNDIGLPARAAALDILAAALARRSGLDEALSAPGFNALPLRDRAFARALAMATLRRLGPIDRALDGRLAKEPPEAVRHILRLGVAQAFLMETPAFAAVATSVDLAAGRRDSRPFKGLVNAVLRNLLREPPDLAAADSLAPDWLMARWRAAYGEDEAQAIAATIAQEPATDLSLRDPSTAAHWAEALEGEILPGGGVRTTRRGDVAAWPGFETGAWWVQDASAAVAARLLEPAPGQHILDLCAAPGGKTLQLAAAGAEVTALDRSAQRLKRLTENLKRTGLAARTLAADGTAWRGGPFDGVLLDAPCASTGTFRRHPDVLWAARPGDIAALAATQARLLAAAAEQVAPHGRLVYCVCSLEPEEGEAQIEAFLRARPDFALEPAVPGEGGAPDASLRPDGTLRILPHHRPGGTDGFYIARMVRQG
ncbi:RsmB/NOP family class I SAM-dependent RNA methyltransferase [Phenylobacterium sp.]|uniref:RsmB/NOP family class I SAM-dependent RNA methyltransferase n=1 Tax=Phenylobacterium sp. TaxID=1871053 RepID=UPI002FD916FA